MRDENTEKKKTYVKLSGIRTLLNQTNLINYEQVVIIRVCLYILYICTIIIARLARVFLTISICPYIYLRSMRTRRIQYYNILLYMQTNDR